MRLGWSIERARAWLAAQAVQAEEANDEPDPDADGGVCAANPDAPLSVWPVNGPALSAWLRLQSQWHRSAWNGKPLGLRYDAARLVIDSTLAHLDAEHRHRVFAELIEMEHAALEACDDENH